MTQTPVEQASAKAPELPEPQRAHTPAVLVQGRRAAGRLVNLAMMVLVAYLVVVPLAILIYSSLKPTTTELPFEVSGFSLDNYRAVFGSPQLASVIFNTTVYVIGALIVALIPSVCLAYLFEKTNIPGRKLLAPLALAPMAVPVTVMAIAWALVANPANGPLALIIEQLTGISINIYSLPGMILVAGLFAVPSMYLMIAPAFARLNPALEEAAATAGASQLSRLRLIVLPLAGPAISAAAMLTVVVALEGFAIPAILGLPDQIFVFSSLIQYSLQPPNGVANYGKASTYGVLILALSMVMLLIYQRRVRNKNRFKVVVGKGYGQSRTPLGQWRIPIALVVWAYMIIAVVLPLLALLWTSLSPYSRPITWSGLSTMTLEPFANIFSTPGIGQIFINTAVVVVVTATATTAISVWISVAASRRQFWGSSVLFESTFLVFGIPSVVLATGVLFLYLYVPIPIYGTIWIIIVALVTRFLPRGSRLVQTALLQLDEGLIEAGRVTGASPFTVTRKILLPLIAPALWKCWLWVFAHALGELPIALLLTGAGNRTLVVLLWDTFTSSVDYPEASALAIIMLVISTIAVWFLHRRGTTEEEAA